MFNRIRIRFIMIASIAIFIILSSIVGIINTARCYQSQQEINRILHLISSNKGKLPDTTESSKRLGTKLSEDSLSQFRYYSVIFNANGHLLSSNTANISALDREEAQYFARLFAKSGEEKGSYRHQDSVYSYLITQLPNEEKLVVILDTTFYFRSVGDLLAVSMMLAFGGFIFFVVLVSLFSGMVIKPFVQNYEKQRRFITNAGHELKTPLAIISANNELVELMTGESEWTKSTSDQVKRLTGLINQMITLARLEEQPDVVLHMVDFSAIAQDAAEDFKSLVLKDGKRFDLTIQPNIMIKAEEKSLFELVTILVDNANKYCDPKGLVKVSLTTIGRRRKRAKLEVSNTYLEGKSIDYSRFFERFYREDESHNSKEKGYGIGLSMAESMVKLFKGTITVNYKNHAIVFTVVI
ncbi:TPA: HAMP domain-containing histidine kinase [Streptococcus pyogenes]|nr:HAMP domain-containing histidine kinase [Streptococcus pyogenes]HER5575848.1 HAMP domain-containing histidine kinase [Streptococcus pyogenes]